MNYKEKIIEILTDSKSWSDIKYKLEAYNTAKTETTNKDTVAGKLFEYFAKGYFIIEPEQNQLYKNVWLFDEIPLKIKEQLSFPLRDFGIDLLLQDYQNRYYAVQCKFKNDEQSILQWSKDKLGNAFGLAEKCDYVLVFTNASNVHSVAKDREKFKFVGYSDLLNIKEEDIEGIRIYHQSFTKPVFKKLNPLPHQEKAISEVLAYYKENDRGQLILPCGAGKTLTALWINERLSAKKTLVLFPSLALLRQFKTEWSRNRNSDFEYICICSEKDIDKNNEDSTVTHTYEITGEVTTNPDRVNSFLISNNPKIVFSTYQSLGVIETALKKNIHFNFDLIICDEAHRTAGSKANNLFTLVHDNKRIRGDKRLYMTATPKVVSNNLKTRLGEDYDLLCDMSNPEIFGGEASRMSFWTAIQEKILVDYKIIGIGVTHKQIKEFIEKRRYVTSKYSIDEIAHNYALDIAMNKYNAFHSITFHHRVKLAKEFSERHNLFFLNTVYSQYVEGNQPTSYRASVLNEFRNSSKGVVSNARCLTEGVDVPTIDLIYFCDPKTSKIDIVQASGRALRKDWHGTKKEGYIVVPIFHYKDDDVEKEIEKKPYFQNLISVIRSLCDQDERLQAEIDSIAFNKGQAVSKRIEITYNDDEVEKIIKLEGLEKKVRDFLFEQIIEKTRNIWNVRFQQLKEYIAEFGNSTISKGNLEYRALYYWAGNLRKYYYLGTLDKKKIRRLNEIGFDWKGENRREITDLDELWRESYNKLVHYFKENNNSNVPARYSKDKPLGTWCVSQRVKRNENKLDDWQIELLEKLDFNWKPKNRFEKFIELLEKYYQENGDYRIKHSETRYGKLPKWVNAYRTIYNTGVLDSEGNIKGQGGTLLKEQIEYLDSKGFLWAERISWDERYEQLTTYFNENGHSNVTTTEDISLYTWCNHQKNNKEKLSEEQIEKLSKVKFSYEINRTNTDDAFLEKLIELSDYFKERKTFYIKQNDKEYGKLRYWLSIVKKEYNAGSLSDEKFDLLKDIGLNLSENQYTLENEQWLEKFDELKKLYKKHKTFFFPKEPEYRSIKSWLQYQRSLYRKGQLKPEREELFNKLGYSLTSNESGNKSGGKIRAERTWISRMGELKDYYSKHKHYRISQKDKQNDSLRTWIQRTKRFYREGKLTEEQIIELKEINFDFTNNWGNRKKSGISKVWLGHFEELRKYYHLKGTFFISKKDKDFLKLHSWLLVQRTTFNQGKLEKEKVKLFESIGYSLTTRYYQKKNYPTNETIDSWELRLNELKEYYEANNSFYIPISDIEHRQLLSWIRVQRSNYKKNTLSQERIDKLVSIGYSFDIMYYGFGKEKKENEEPNENARRTWEANYLKLINYKIVNGHCNVPRTYKEDSALANFVSRQRYNYRRKKLTIDQIKKLELINFEWEGNRQPDYDEVWMKNYTTLKKIFSKTGNSHIKKGFADNTMYTWTLQQRMKRRKNKLTQEQIKMLDAIKFVWNPVSTGGSPDDDAWLAMLEQLSLYKMKFGDCNVSQLNKDYKKLGRWVNDQRLNYSRGKLHEHRKELLEELGFIWNTKEYEFDLKIKMLQEFYQKNGHFDVKQSDKEFGGLYDWLHKLIKNGTTEERIKKLESIGFYFKL